MSNDRERLTEAEHDALAGAIHDAIRCNCDSGEGDRMIADNLAPAVLALIAGRAPAQPDAAQALRDAAEALNIEGLNYKPDGWGSNPADIQTVDALAWVMTWLNARADRLAAGTE